jgi:hypothetical protein
MQKTNSTLPEYFMEDQGEERSLKLKPDSKQVPISHRKKASYLKQLKREGSHSKKSEAKVVLVDF